MASSSKKRLDWNGSDQVSHQIGLEMVSPRLRMQRCKKDLFFFFFRLLATSWFASLHVVMEQERVFLKKTLRQGEKTTLEVIRWPSDFLLG